MNGGWLSLGSKQVVRADDIEALRERGRAIRTALTQDMWEALNDGWRQLGQMDAETALKNLPSLL